MYQLGVLPWGLICLFLYPIGVPLLYATMLFRNRLDLNPAHHFKLACQPSWECIDIDDDAKVEEEHVDDDERTAAASSSPNNKIRSVAAATTTTTTTALLARSPAYQEAIRDLRDVRAEGPDVAIKQFKFLWGDYSPRCYYWEVVEVIRRIFYTALIAIIGYGTKLQALLALVLSIVWLQLHTLYAPFNLDDDDFIYSVAHSALSLTFLIALAARVAIDLGGKAATTPLLFAAVVMPLFAVVYVFCGLEKSRRARAVAAAAGASLPSSFAGQQKTDAPPTPSSPRPTATNPMLLPPQSAQQTDPTSATNLSVPPTGRTG
jgi:hypothetical protein